MSPVLHKLARSEKGFTLAEVIIAMVVFVASIVGISMMLMSGSGAVTRGAMENAATQLAQKKIEDIKTLPFYTPYTGANQDVDDFYFNTAYTNQDLQQLTAVQTSNPAAYEDYGSISGYGKYKRTTAIQYQTVTPSALTPTTMETSPGTWVPKAATGNIVVLPQFDKPKDSSGNPIRMLLAVVTVYYHDPNSGLEVSYKAQSVVSDLMTTGGTNNPILQVKSINPTSGDLNNTNFTMDVTVVSQGLTSSDTVSVYLWYEGQTDNPATSVTVISSTDIRCVFNLADHTAADNSSVTVRPGVYSIAVYWQNKGWKDTSFRNCFTVTTPPPGFSSISNHTWGYNGQTARPVVITGSAFQYVQTVTLTNGANIITGIITNNPSTTEIDCNFDLSTITSTVQCPITITTRGGSIMTTAAQGLLVNPKPIITNIVQTTGTVFSWGYYGLTSARQVQFQGQYLYGFNPTYDTSTRKLTSPNSTYTTSNATFISGGYGNTCDAGVSGYDTNNLTLTYDLTSPSISSGAAWTTANTMWSPVLMNAGGTAAITNTSPGANPTQQLYMNPTPVITSIQPTSSGNYYSWVHSKQTARNICITGNYLYGFYGNGSINGYEDSPTGAEAYIFYNSTYKTTGNVPCVSGPTGNELSPLGQSAVFTINPNSAGVGYALAGLPDSSKYWNTYLRNYGGLVHNVGTGTAGGQVLFNPTPQITGITATASNYYNWATLGLGSRYVQVQGNYLYGLNDSGALAQLSYGTNYTLDIGTGRLISPPNLNIEIGIGDAVTVNVQPSTVSIADKYSVPDSYWNVRVGNYGGTVDSNASNAANLGMSVFMNPHPTVTTIVTGTSDTNWTYRAQTSRTVTITGTNLYSLNAGSPAAAKICYGYGASATTYNYFNGTYTDPGCNFALNTSYSVTMTFNPSSGNYSGTGANNGVYYELYLKNFGTPTAGYNTDPTGATLALGICMNPAPVSVTDTLPATVTTGTAATNPVSGGGTKTTTSIPPTGIYKGLTASGGYFQTGATVYFIQSNTMSTSSDPFVTLAGGTGPSGDGATGMNFGSVQTLNVTVGGSTTAFKLYNTATAAGDNVMQPNTPTSYYIIVYNPDGQWAVSSTAHNLTHASYTTSFAARQVTSQNTTSWGAFFGTPDATSVTGYQDGSVSIHATAGNVYAWFVDWENSSGSVVSGAGQTWNFSAGSYTGTYYCRFAQYLFAPGNIQVVPWGNNNQNTPYYFGMNETNAKDGNSTGWVHQEGQQSWGNGGDCGWSTNSGWDFTHCTTAYAYCQQEDSSGGWGTFAFGTKKDGDDTSGRLDPHWERNCSASQWGSTPTLVSFPITSVNLNTGKAWVRIHAVNDGVDWSKFWTKYVYVQ